MINHGKTTLRELHTTHSGKVTDKWSGYFGIYDRIFQPYRDRAVALLEIGIQNGGSLEVWSRYFPNAEKIVGVDIDPKCGDLRYDDRRIEVIVGDINADDTRSAITAAASAYDIIIDDGSHTSGDIVRTFSRLFPLLEEGGVFVVEDMCCAYWGAFDGGLHHPTSSMAFFKALADCINSEHWGTDTDGRTHLLPFLEHHNTDLNEDLLAGVHSVEIANAVVVIRKGSPTSNLMGPRLMGGQVALVNPTVLAMDGDVWISDERNNPFAREAVGTGNPLPRFGRFLRRKFARGAVGTGNPPDTTGSNPGYCDCCEQTTEFWIRDPWLRDHYLCRNCGAIPRFRALQHVLNRQFPDWKSASLHESSPSNSNLSRFNADYSASQFFGNENLGDLVDGVRNENLEALTFDDASFDLFVTMDVLEHVFDPAAACREIMRALKPGGAHVFTAPKHPGLRTSYSRARMVNGEIDHLLEPDYHGNPIGDGRALVTWDYGDDFEHLLADWSGFPPVTYVTRDRALGLDGEYLEVFVIRKPLE